MTNILGQAAGFAGNPALGFFSKGFYLTNALCALASITIGDDVLVKPKANLSRKGLSVGGRQEEVIFVNVKTLLKIHSHN